MPSRFRLPPNVRALQKFDVNRRGEVEAVRQSLYDFQTYARDNRRCYFSKYRKGKAEKRATIRIWR